MTSLSDIPKSDRPREKLQQKGPAALADVGLLAVLLGKGTKECDVMTLAEKILKVLAEQKEKPVIEESSLVPTKDETATQI